MGLSHVLIFYLFKKNCQKFERFEMVAGGTVANRLANKVARGWRVKTVEKWRLIQLSEKEKYGNSYFKEMLNQTPGLAVALGATAVSVGLLVYAHYLQAEHHLWSNFPYKRRYTVFRPDDPRIERLRNLPNHYNQEGTVPDPQPRIPSKWLRFAEQ